MTKKIPDPKGYVKLWRKIWKDPICKKPKYLVVFLYIISHANHEDKNTIINNKKVKIKRGSYIGSIKKIAEYFNIARSTVSYILDYLVSDTKVDIKTTNKYTVFTVKNYDKWQPSDTKVDNKETSKKHQRNTTKNYKNVKKDITMNSNTQNADTASKDEKKKEYGNKQVNHVISSFKQYFHKDPVGTRKEVRFAARNMCQTINAKYREIKDTDGVAPMKNFKKAVDSCFREVAMDDFLADNIKTIRSAYNHSKEIIKNFTKKED